MLSLDIDLSNKPVVDNIILPRLRHLVEHSKIYSFNTKDLNYYAHAKIDSVKIDISCVIDHHGMRELKLFVVEVDDDAQVHITQALEVNMKHISQMDIRISDDEVCRLLSRFMQICNERETEAVISAYKRLLNDDKTDRKVVRLVG